MQADQHRASDPERQDQPGAGSPAAGQAGATGEGAEEAAKRLPSFTPMEDSDDPNVARKLPGFTPQGRTDSSPGRTE